MATLKISELSVDDWVRWTVYNKTYDIRITQITDILIRGVHDGIEYGMKITQMSPIPITAEILEKNGFVRRNSEFPIYEYTTLLGKMLRVTVVGLNHPYNYIVCRIEDTSKELHEFDRIPVNTSVERSQIYIHDLQHALRLAGVDKEINL